ncbi:putative zn-dependent protease with chaperone function [Mycobacterium xenopi 3993]|nr:putative zn-dependent protease with chaperone function [Mycobacterium xenopi 3993]
MVLCVLTITLVCIAVVPALLDRVTPMTSPVVRLTAWLATLVTVLGAVLALPVIAMATGHAATATVVSVPIALLAQGIWRRYTEIMRSTREHAQAVYLISRPANGVRSQTPVVTIDSVLPLVYCLPGHPALSSPLPLYGSGWAPPSCKQFSPMRKHTYVSVTSSCAP